MAYHKSEGLKMTNPQKLGTTLVTAMQINNRLMESQMMTSLMMTGS